MPEKNEVESTTATAATEAKRENENKNNNLISLHDTFSLYCSLGVCLC